MIRLRNYLLIVLILPLVSFAQNDSNTDFASYISEKNLKKNVMALCSQNMQGRETGTKGQKLAADYIYKQFKRAGIKAINRSHDSLAYFQSFGLSKLKIPSGSLKIDNKTYHNYKDFVANPIQDSIFKDLDIVFIGSSPIENYSKIDFSNKAVLFLTDNFHKAFSQAHKIWAHSKPSLILFCDPFNNCLFNRYIHTCKSMLNNRFHLNKPINIADTTSSNKDSNLHSFLRSQQLIAISTRLAKAITGLNKKSLKSMVNSQIRPKLTNQKLKFELRKNNDQVRSENVIALIEGSEKPNEYIIISAHYDHLGKKNGLVYHGANDNASGTSALIEVAKSFKLATDKGKAPKKSIIFAAFSAEEKGLLGSEFFVNNPPVSIKSIKTNLNMDMLGRRDVHHNHHDYIYLLGASHLNPKLKQTSDSLNALFTNLTLDYTYDYTHHPLYGASDQASFVNKKIPAIMYFNGLHEDYHTTGDTADKLNFKNIKQVAQLVFLTAWELANEL